MDQESFLLIQEKKLWLSFFHPLLCDRDLSYLKLSMKNDVVRIQEANASGNPGKGKDGFTDLEKFLKEKTFTRYTCLGSFCLCI